MGRSTGGWRIDPGGPQRHSRDCARGPPPALLDLSAGSPVLSVVMPVPGSTLTDPSGRELGGPRESRPGVTLWDPEPLSK
jgi:hypothetical protein